MIAENLSNLRKELDIQVQETQRNPNKIKSKRSTSKYIIIKMVTFQNKERILKASWEKSKTKQNKKPYIPGKPHEPLRSVSAETKG